MSATRTLVQNIVNKSPAPLPGKKKKKMSKAAQKTAAKVQLMKLKQKSVGMAGIPQTERVHFLVESPSGKSVGCWVSRTWSMGRVVDSVADSTGTENRNNMAGEKRLKIFRTSDGKGLCGKMEKRLEELVTHEEVFDGDSLLLQYVEEGVEEVVVEQ